MHKPRGTWSATIARQCRLGNYPDRFQSSIDHRNIPIIRSMTVEC